MKILEKQMLFMTLVPRLLDKLHELGYQATLGDGYRDPRVFGAVGVFKGYGHRNSGHKRRLALDINLFKDGEYIDGETGHRELGAWWKQQHELCRWGGDFGDPNHYSLEHEGVK